MTTISKSSTILVTGISGFVGKWTALELLKKGYRVRGTLRDMAKAEAIAAALIELAGKSSAKRLEFVQADLLDDAYWGAAMAGVDAVMHVATAVLAEEPKNPDEVIAPALDGTRRVLEHAQAAGIKRIIMTSSIATVGYGLGHTSGKRVYTENDWTHLDGMRWKWAYCIGKTKAERAAWAYCEEHGIDLTTIHPGAILGPLIDNDASVSVGLVGTLLDGSTPAVPNIGFSISDVRDVAAMHVAALEKPESYGERYLATADYLPFIKIAEILAEAYPQGKVPVKTAPDWILKLMVPFNRALRQIANDIGTQKHFDGSKGAALLGRNYIAAKETLIDTAESALKFGLFSMPNGSAQ